MGTGLVLMTSCLIGLRLVKIYSFIKAYANICTLSVVELLHSMPVLLHSQNRCETFGRRYAKPDIKLCFFNPKKLLDIVRNL